MDTEWFELKDWALQILQDYKAELLEEFRATKKRPSALKKVDRFINALGVDTEQTYADMLETARVKNMSAAELARKGRRMEETIMDAFRVLPDDPAHHMYSLRTAGDLIQNVSSKVREEGLQILKDQGYDLGNVRRNLISLAEYVHQGRPGRGLEYATLGDVVVDKNKVAIAHPRGTGDPLISKTIDAKNIKTGQDFANAYLPLLQQQTQDVQGALATSAPREAILSKAVEEGTGIKNIFSTARTIEEVKTGRQFLQTVPDVVRQSYLTFKGGKAVLGMLPMGALATAAFTAADVAQAAQGVSSVQQATSTPEAVAGGLEAASGVLGVAATKVPVLVGPAAVLGVTGGAIRMRMQRDIEREQVQQVMAGERSEYGPAVTQTPTLTRTKTNYERNIQARMKARKRR